MIHSFPVLAVLLGGETLTIEYKEDFDEKNKHGPYSIEKIAESLMAISNQSGGYLLLGVSDSGQITGINKNRQSGANAVCLDVSRKFARTAALAFHEYHETQGTVFAFYIAPAEPPPHQLLSGVFKIRKDLGSKNGPQNVPFLLAEMPQWEAQRGIHADFSSRLLPHLSLERVREYFNPIAVSLFQTRMQQGRINNAGLKTIPTFEGQMEALGLVGTANGVKVLTNAALILFGSNDALTKWIPYHRTQFQAFGANGELIYNYFSDKPGLEHRCLLYLADRLDELSRSVIKRSELMDGNFRIDIPEYGDDAVREATMNAFIHRDYTQAEEVIIQVNPTQFLITNPGGFYRDVTPQNILFHEPCPRNHCLAQACADIGLVEKSGRGVDRIFWDQIRFMRPLPSYAASTTSTVRLSLLGGNTSLDVVRWMFEFFAGKEDLTVRVVHGGLIQVLVMEGQATREAMIAALPGLSDRYGRAAITELIDAGIITRIGHGKGQRLVLSEQMQNALGKTDAFRRQAGIADVINQQQRIIEYVKEKGSITRKEAAQLLNIPPDNNLYRRLIEPLLNSGSLYAQGEGTRKKYIVNVQSKGQQTN